MANYSFIPPVDRHIRISSFYGNRKNPFGVGISTHNGIDFACPMGSNVYASADGKVVWVGNNNTYGNAVIIEHQGGYLTLSAHLSKINVRNGEYVYQGQRIALSGNTGHSTGPHLHFETIDGNIKINNTPIKEIIKANNGKIGKDGYNHLGITGKIGRYNVFTGKLLEDNNNTNIDRNRTIADYNIEQNNQHPHYTRETLPTKYYIWHTQGDDKVRSSHEELDGTIHSIDEDIFPGEDYNCRCWAEEISDEEALR
ncbi:MAG: peptidoglycan DD-metalloendopeptidase family protein [Rickettsiales bacterium]|nr:peptidoglycan DD-metalloendopeptidase family protein [Rickettsiales bacterium]